MTDWLIIDGAHGEGGGQILRTALTLSVITRRAIRIETIRAGRRNPGLAAQHLTAVRAAARLCGAAVAGAELGSQRLEFVPQHEARPGDYLFDVAAAREGGSAGAVILVLQTVLLPLALATGNSTVILRGGTHVMSSPSFDYADDVWLATLTRMGVCARLKLLRSGWYPVGQGEVRVSLRGSGQSALNPLRASEPGVLRRIRGRALAANLPAHVPQRMADHARAALKAEGLDAQVDALSVRAACPGAAILLTAEYENCLAGFEAIGKRGRPAELVADEACSALLRHHRSGAALEAHLADQVLLPAALAPMESAFSVESFTRHLETNAWVVQRFGLARVTLNKDRDGKHRVRVRAL